MDKFELIKSKLEEVTKNLEKENINESIDKVGEVFIMLNDYLIDQNEVEEGGVIVSYKVDYDYEE